MGGTLLCDGMSPFALLGPMRALNLAGAALALGVLGASARGPVGVVLAVTGMAWWQPAVVGVRVGTVSGLLVGLILPVVALVARLARGVGASATAAWLAAAIIGVHPGVAEAAWGRWWRSWRGRRTLAFRLAAALLVALRRLEEARVWAGRAVAAAGRPQDQVLLGNIAGQLGDLDAAGQAFQAALVASLEHPEAAAGLRAVAARRGSALVP